MIPPKAFFTIKDASKLTGLSVAMVDYLCKTKIAVPTYSNRRGRGHLRQYSFGDVVLLRALARVLNAGVSVLNLKRALQGLRKFHPDITPATLPGTYVVTDGIKVFFRQKAEVIEELGSGQLAFMFVLELSRIKDEVLCQLNVEAPEKNGAKFLYELKAA